MCVGMLALRGRVFVLTSVCTSACVHRHTVAMVTGVRARACQGALQPFSAQHYLVSSSGSDGGGSGLI